MSRLPLTVVPVVPVVVDPRGSAGDGEGAEQVCRRLRTKLAFSALHDAAGLKQHALAVHQQAVVLKLMPLNNATQITEDERVLIRRWFEAGAPTAP